MIGVVQPLPAGPPIWLWRQLWPAWGEEQPPDTEVEAASRLGVHAMDPDRRHALCGFDMMGGSKLPSPPSGMMRCEPTCPLCLAVLAAVG